MCVTPTPMPTHAVVRSCALRSAAEVKAASEEADAMNLDDFFRKTTAKPCLYYLPNSDERIALLKAELAAKQTSSGA